MASTLLGRSRTMRGMRKVLFFGGVAFLAAIGGSSASGCAELELPGTVTDAAASVNCLPSEDCPRPPPCKDPVMFVSAKGDDKNDGCSKAKPKATIKAAVDAVAASRAGESSTDDSAVADRYDVRVCAGTYKEQNLVVTHPMNLRGGFDCSTFERDAGFGYDKGFASTNETIIENGAYSKDNIQALAYAVRRESTRINRDVVLEGFTIDPGGGPSGSVGLVISDGTSPTIRDNKIKGGSGVCDNGFGSMAVWVVEGSPLLFHNDVNGGTGKCLDSSAPSPGNGIGTGSYGMYLQGAGNIDVEENKISGGSGNGADGAVAITVASVGRRKIHKNFITWDKPRTDANGYTAAAGILAVGETDLEITDNVIRGGTTTCWESCLSWGMLTSESERLRIERNKVYGGDVIMDPPATTGNPDRSQVFVRGIRVDKSGDALIANNMVHSGGLTTITESPGVKTTQDKFYNERNATGIMLDDRGRGARVIHNTVITVSGDPARTGDVGSQKGGTGWDLVRPFYLAIGYERATFQKNLAIAHGGGPTSGSSFGFTVVEADQGLELVEENAFVNFTGPAVVAIHAAYSDGRPAPPTEVFNAFKDVKAYNAVDQTGITGIFRNNKFIRSACAGDPDCEVDPAFDGKWSAVGLVLDGKMGEADQGTEDLFGLGWKLKPSVKAILKTGGGAVSPTIGTDFYGAPRTAPVAYGAHELE